MPNIRCFGQMSAKLLVMAIAVFGFAKMASAQQLSPIKGRVYIAGKTPVDPPPNEPKNTHAYLTIQGPGAVRMYRAMTASAQDDLCRGHGWTIKRAGPFACSLFRGGKKAECDFSIKLKDGTLAAGSPC